VYLLPISNQPLNPALFGYNLETMGTMLPNKFSDTAFAAVVEALNPGSLRYVELYTVALIWCWFLRILSLQSSPGKIGRRPVASEAQRAMQWAGCGGAAWREICATSSHSKAMPG
jgi:hypothetical protein